METPYFNFGGIDLSRIHNSKDFHTYFDGLQCCVCAKIVRDPVECEKCDTLYCKNCYESLKILNIKEDCNVSPKRANKFLRSILSKLLINCEFCDKTNINYDDYNKHLTECKLNRKFTLLDDYITKINDLDEEISKLEVEKSNSEKNKINEYQYLNSFSEDYIREKLLKNNLLPAEKKELYQACIDENPSSLMNLIENKGYPVTEELSTKGHYWTALHYAMHFGKWEVIRYLLEYCKRTKKLGPLFRLKSDDNRCPILCLLKSNAISNISKNDIICKIVENFPEVYFSQNAINECANKNIDANVIKKIKFLQEKLKTSEKLFSYEYCNLSDNEIRDKFLNFTFTPDKKKIIYEAITKDDIEILQINIKNEFDLFEELSSKGYYWTCLHYALHFAAENVIIFMFKLLEEVEMINIALNLKTNDSRSPLMCLIKSNSVCSDRKTNLMNKILTLFPKIHVPMEVRQEIKKRKYKVNFIRGPMDFLLNVW